MTVATPEPPDVQVAAATFDVIVEVPTYVVDVDTSGPPGPAGSPGEPGAPGPPGDSMWTDIPGGIAYPGAAQTAGMVTVIPVGVAKGRFGGLPGTSDWVGTFLNAAYTPSGWVLDDPNKWGMFFKMDMRSPVNDYDNFAVFAIPPGASPHTDEYPIFAVSMTNRAVKVHGPLNLAQDPTGPLQAATKQYVDAKPAGGTLILDGVGLPDAAAGVIGNYYLDTVGQVLYGPKRDASGELEQPRYILLSTPTEQGAGTYALAMKYAVHVGGQVIGARFWRYGPGTMLSRTMRLYNSGHALVATSNPSTETAGYDGWVEVTFPTPFVLAPGDTVTIAYDEQGFKQTTGAPVIAEPSRISWVEGRYGTVWGEIPPNGVQTTYMADLLWQPASSAWPVALIGATPTATTRPSGVST